MSCTSVHLASSRMRTPFLIALLLSQPICQCAQDLMRVCCFPSWRGDSMGITRFEVNDIDPDLCTHLVYSFAEIDINHNRIKPMDAAMEEGETGRFRTFTKLKKRSPQLKTLLSTRVDLSQIVNTSQLFIDTEVTRKLGQNIVSFLRDRNFDGLSIDWQYRPLGFKRGQGLFPQDFKAQSQKEMPYALGRYTRDDNGPSSEVIQTFIKLTKALREQVNADSQSPKLLLTWIVPGSLMGLDRGFQATEYASYVDHIYIRTYYFIDTIDVVVRLRSPVYHQPNTNKSLSINDSIKYWHHLGLPYQSLVVGLTGMGRWYVLADPQRFRPGSPATIQATRGEHYMEPHGLAYPEVCEMLKDSTARAFVDNVEMCAFLVRGRDWVSYENEHSLTKKVDWIKKQNVGGVMFEFIDEDDFTGAAGPVVDVMQVEMFGILVTVLAGHRLHSLTAIDQHWDHTRVEDSEFYAGAEVCSAQWNRFCYFHGALRSARAGPPFLVTHVDLSLCTHLLYAYACVDSSALRIRAMEPSVEDGPSGVYSNFVDTKRSNPQLMTLLSIGGPGQQSRDLQDVAATDAFLRTFASRAVLFLLERNFDGLNVDWQGRYNGQVKVRLSKLLHALHTAFVEETQPRLMLTFAGSGLPQNVDAGFNVTEIASYVDYVLIQAYNLVLPNMTYASFGSALFHNPQLPIEPTLNVNYSVLHWHEKGLPYSKILVGLTGQGRYLKLYSRDRFEPGSRVTSEVLYSNYYNVTSGILYPEVCIVLRDRTKSRYFDDVQGNPYLMFDDAWIGYEDKESIDLKLQWMARLGVAGIMFAGLHEDDFTGKLCNDGKYPLLTFVYEKLNKLISELEMITTQEPPTTEEFLPSKGHESSSVIIYFACIFALGFFVTGYGLYVFLSKGPVLIRDE